MLCRICKDKGVKTKAVIFIKHHKLPLCKKHFTEWFERYTMKTVERYKMISNQDKILVAVSGGKDSISISHILKKLGFSIKLIHIKLGIDDDNYSDEALKACIELSRNACIPLYMADLKEIYGYDIKTIAKRAGRKDVCSVCGTIKRYLTNRIAIEQGFDVLVTGHNLDDESALLLSNVIRWDTFFLQRQFPVLDRENGFIKKAKPFCLLTEKEILGYAVINGLKFSLKECPFSKKATSKVFKTALAYIEHKMPGTKLRFYKEFLKQKWQMFKPEHDRVQLKKCKLCGMPSGTDECSVCRLLKKARINITPEIHLKKVA